ncbi:MAG: HAD family hydrolase [Thermodesulfobacteriota bacterium]
MYQAVLFDLDGTLLDSLADLAHSMNAVLSRAGLPQHPLAAYRYFVGDGMETLARRVLPGAGGNEALVQQTVAAMREEYAGRWAEETRPYEGVPQLLDTLAAHGVTMAILSNKPDDFTKKVVATLLGRWRFVAVRGVGADGVKKPDPGQALAIAAELGIPAANFLYLGDTNTDMLTANRAGMHAVGALWGFRTAEELKKNGAKALIARPQELLQFFASP